MEGVRGPALFDNRPLVLPASHSLLVDRSAHSAWARYPQGAIPVLGCPCPGMVATARTWGPHPRGWIPLPGCRASFPWDPQGQRKEAGCPESSLTPKAAPLVGSGYELMALSQKWRVGETERQRGTGDCPRCYAGDEGLSQEVLGIRASLAQLEPLWR